MGAATFGATIELKDKFGSTINKNLESLSKFEQGTRKAESSASAFSSSSGRMASGLKGIATAAVAAFSIAKVTEGIKSLTEAGLEDEQVQNRFNTLMGNVKGMTDEGKASVEAMSKSISGYGVVSKDATLAGAGQLATFQLSADSINTLLPCLDDLIVSQKGVNSTEEDAQGMANLVGKAMTGNAGALTRYGVTLTDTQKKLIETGTQSQRAAAVAQALESNYGNLNKTTAMTAAGGIQRLKNQMQEMKEDMGAKLLPTVTQITGALAGLMSGTVSPEQFGSQISTTITGVLTSLTGALPKVVSVGSQIFTSLISGIVTNLPLILSSGINLLQELINGILSAMPKLVGILPQIIQSIVTFITTNLPTIIQIGMQILNVLVSGITMAIPQIIQALPQIMIAFVNGIIQNLPTIIPAGIELIVALISGLIQAIPQLIAAMPQIISAIITSFQNVDWIGLGVEILQGIWEGMKSIGAGIGSWFKGLFHGGDTKVSASGDAYASGTTYARGGWSLVGEQGPELVNLPRGSSVNTTADTKSMLHGSGSVVITIPKLADQIIVREDSDIDRIATALAEKLQGVDIAGQVPA